MKGAFRTGASKQEQADALQQLVTKHLSDPAYQKFVGSEDFALTSTERGIQRWEHAHVVAALDVLNAYQRDRCARASCSVGNLRLGRSRKYTCDPRTRMCELLKRWLRTNVANSNVGEEEVRSICGLCRDVLNHPQLFPARNPRSFLQSVADVYDHMQVQLQEVLERDRSCAELSQRVLSLSRNLISDVVGYLLLAPTDLRQTDALPSVEVVALWQSLPDLGHPLPGRADVATQKAMKEAWTAQTGALLAAVLSTPWCVRLFNGARAEEEAVRAIADRSTGDRDRHGCSSRAISAPASARSLGDRQASGARGPGAPAARSVGAGPSSRALAAIDDLGAMGAQAGSLRSLPVTEVGDEDIMLDESRGVQDIGPLIAEVEAQFDRGHFKGSGLAGAFREVEQAPVRGAYLSAVRNIFDLVYLLSEVLVQFHRVSDGLGDYGMIRMAPWLHPFLDTLQDKVQRLKHDLQTVNQAVDANYVMARARKAAIAKPAPSTRMGARAHTCIERAVTGRGSHIQSLAQAIEELKARSAPERLPAVSTSLGDACTTLQAVFQSPGFRAAVGDAFPELPPLSGPVGQVQDGAAARAIADAAPCGVQATLVTEDGSVQRHASPGRDLLDAALSSSEAARVESAESERSTTDSSSRSRASSSEIRRRPKARSTVSSGSQSGDVAADVWFMTKSKLGKGLKRRDRRTLALKDGALLICSRGSRCQVGEAVDPAIDLEFCTAGPDAILLLSVRVPPEGKSSAEGVYDLQDYAFEFDEAWMAGAFRDRLLALLPH